MSSRVNAERGPVYEASLKYWLLQKANGPDGSISPKSLVIDEDSTPDLPCGSETPSDCTNQWIGMKISEFGPQLSTDTIHNFVKRIRTTGKVKGVLHLSREFSFASDQEIRSYFKNPSGGGWAAFCKAHPDAGGIFEFSQIGFNKDLNQAFLYLSYSCGPLCGDGEEILLEKHWGRWRVIQLKNVWVS